MMSPDPRKAGLMRKGALASVAVAATLVAAKGAAFLTTGSVALLGSLADSVLDLFASLVNFFAIRAALVPADEEHRFGHGKVEAIAGLFQSALIFGSSAFLIWRSALRIAEPVPIAGETLGIGVSLLAIALTLLLVGYQKRVVRETGSVAITADRLHYVGDVMLNLSVIAALVLATRFGIPAADGWFGLGIALYIGSSAYRIAKASVDILMDREFTVAEREQIFNLTLENPEVKGLHELKTRRSGLNSFIQMHIEVDPEISIKKAHAIADEVEATVGEAFPDAEIIIHTDPLGLEPEGLSERELPQPKNQG
jgi:ferrous-iron efflux pump FieF